MSNTDVSSDLASALRPRINRIYQLLRRRTPHHSYTGAQSSALTTLLDHGPLRMGELAERESVRMPTITAQIDGLTRLGLVERRADPTDRRAVLVDLSPEGRTALDELRRDIDQAVREALADMSAEHRAALEAAIPALIELERRLGILAAGQPIRMSSEADAPEDL